MEIKSSSELDAVVCGIYASARQKIIREKMPVKCGPDRPDWVFDPDVHEEADICVQSVFESNPEEIYEVPLNRESLLGVIVCVTPNEKGTFDSNAFGELTTLEDIPPVIRLEGSILPLSHIKHEIPVGYKVFYGEFI